ncbi:hypothetical protein HZ994_03365 [Akkermansiaceae bacterium]|nr:hypothetical protein HZ994_03365 [Akkermansiaceae bacterium]
MAQRIGDLKTCLKSSPDMFMRKATRYAFLFLASILPLAGQERSADAGKPKKPARSAWFACIAPMPEGVENPIKVAGEKEITEILLPSYMTSDPVEIPADGILRMVRGIPDPEKPGETKYLILAEAKIPEGVREALVLLAPLPEPQGDLVFLAKVQNLADFKGGDRLFINLSDTNIRAKFGRDTVTVAPGKSDIYQAPALAKPTNTPVMYEFYHAGQKQWKILSASTVVLRPTRREICVFNSGTRPGNIKKHKILFPVPVATTQPES